MSRTQEFYSKFFSFEGGMNNAMSSALIGDNELQACSNVFIKNGRMYKRPGKSPYGPTFVAGCKGMCEYTDTDGTTYLIVASDGHLYNVSSTAKTDLGTITDEKLSFVSSRGTLFINGPTVQKKLKKTVLSDVGLAAPATAPTVAVGAATGLTGSYAWKCTYVIGSAEYESNPSASSASLILADEKATITPPASADTRVTSRNIYRTVAGGDSWYYEGAIANNTPGATFTSGSVSDITLTAPGASSLVETNHGQPDTGQYSEVCNGVMFRLKGTHLYFSEIGKTFEYLEYQTSTNDIRLLGTGNGTGLKSLYNPNTGKEDLYIFQNSFISMLPNGDPTQPLYLIREGLGCVAHDTIRRHGGRLFFLSNKSSICLLTGGTAVDVTTLNIYDTIADIISSSSAFAEIVFDNYYALCTRNDTSKLYNTYIVLVDLTTISLVDSFNNRAKSCSFFWTLNFQYTIQKADGTVIFFDDLDKHIYSLSLDNYQDSDVSSVLSNIPEFWFQTKSHGGKNLFDLMRIEAMRVLGVFEQNVTVLPYALDRAGTSSLLSVAGESFIMGESVMGDAISSIQQASQVSISEACVAAGISFRFSQNNKDERFEFSGYQLTYQVEKEGK